MTVEQANARWGQLNQEIAELEKSANDHEAEARAARLKRQGLKEERQQLAVIVQSQQAVSVIQKAQRDAADAKAAADTDRAEAAKSREEHAKLLEELKGQKSEVEKVLAEAKAAIEDVVS